jgi:hypothetical protein
MKHTPEIFSICSEFTDKYGMDLNDNETLVVYCNSKYINELKEMLSKRNYKLYSFQVYEADALIKFIPNKQKNIDF